MGKENLFKCFCKTREMQDFYTKCLSEGDYTSREKEIIYGLIKEVAISAEKIKSCFNSSE